MNYKLAAGILPYCPTTKRFLISQRGPDITEPNKWVCFGGKADDGETEQYTAIREFREESGYKGKVKLINKPFYNYNKLDGFKFATFIGLVPNEFIPTTINKETVDGDIEIQDAKWIDKQQLFKLIDSDIIHRGFNTFLLKLFKIKENMKLTENVWKYKLPISDDSALKDLKSKIAIISTDIIVKKIKDKGDVVVGISIENIPDLENRINVDRKLKAIVTDYNNKVFNESKQKMIENEIPKSIAKFQEKDVKGNWTGEIIYYYEIPNDTTKWAVSVGKPINSINQLTNPSGTMSRKQFKTIDSLKTYHKSDNIFLKENNMKLTENQSDNKYAVAYMINKSDGKKIKGEVRWNSHWKRFQVVVDGTIYEEFRDFDEALDNLERSGV